MALAGLRRLTTHLHSATALTTRTTTTIPSHSAKVSDRMVNLYAIDPDGHKRSLIGLSGQTLLKALTNHGLIDPASHRLEEIEACSAECEVHIATEWMEKLPRATYEEEYVLRRNARSRELNRHARLACQVVVAKEMEGMVVAVPEPKAWDIP
ncbi:hypothetical protein Droror1_Dr00022145 [Drosera rotundifolia]